MNTTPPELTAKQKEIMISLLEANFGNVRKAAMLAKIAPSTHYRWRKEDAEYEKLTDSMKDICYRNLKENLIDMALKKAEKDSAVLNQLMRIFLKNMPEEMKALNRCNDVPLRATIKYVDKPPGWDEEMRRHRERANGNG